MASQPLRFCRVTGQPAACTMTRWPSASTIASFSAARYPATSPALDGTAWRKVMKPWMSVSYTHLTLPTNREV